MSGEHAQMDAWQFDRFGEPSDVLVQRRIAVPHPASRSQLLVRVDSAAVNFADDLMIRGTYQSRPALPAIPGMEVCGVVVSEGGAVPRLRRVAGLTDALSGGFAEFAILEAVHANEVPADFTDEEACAFTVSYQTAWFAIHVRAALTSGETLLVHAAAGGVGSAAVQLGKASGALVIGVVGRESKRTVALSLGCDHVVIRTDVDAIEQIKAITNGRGVDVVVDPVGGASHLISARTIAFEGRIVIVGFAGGTPSKLSAEHALVKNYSLLGLHWGLYRSHRPQLVDEAYSELCAVVQAHGIRPLISSELDFSDLPAALEALSQGSTTGRVVLTRSSSERVGDG